MLDEWKNKITTGHSEDSDDVQLMYSECAEAMTSDANQYFHNFYIEKSNLHFTGEHCGGPAYKSEDEFDKSISFAELKPYLSDYGKKLLK